MKYVCVYLRQPEYDIVVELNEYVRKAEEKCLMVIRVRKDDEKRKIKVRKKGRKKLYVKKMPKWYIGT